MIHVITLIAGAVVVTAVLAIPLQRWALVCLVSGVVSVLLLNIPMYVQSEGYRPAYVAAGVISGASPTAASGVLAVAVHHVAGVVVALGYGAVVVLLSGALPTVVSLNGVPLVPHLVGAVAVTLFTYYFFTRVALPRAGRSVPDADAVVEQWALTAFIYGTALALLVPVLVTQL